MNLLSWKRFGTETPNPDQGISTQVDDLPLSQGFHWEAVPGSPLGKNLDSSIRLSSQPPDFTQTQPEAGTKRASQAQGFPELPNDSKQDGKGVPVKEEHIQDFKKEDFAEPSSARTMKRKATTVSK